MKKKAYHHGNLKETLIEKGLEMIHQNGIAQFSLRKLAKQVGVSPTACYNHFESAEALLQAMREYVTDKFCHALEAAIPASAIPASAVSETLADFGASYVVFFAENPHYFTFVFDAENYHITLAEDDFYGDYRPFQIFRDFSILCLKELGIPDSHHKNTLVSMWATVHGLAAMANMKGFSYDGDWALLTKQVLLHSPTV